MKRVKSKFVYIIGSAVIGIIVIIFILAGLFLSGAIDARSVKLVFESSSKEILYDGTTLTCEEWGLVDGELKDGHTAEVVFTGKQTDVGTSENTFSVTIKDQNGADVTEDYELEFKLGLLTVAPRSITVTSATDSKEYDGLPLKKGEAELTSGSLLEGHTLEMNVTGEITDAGSVNNEVYVQIFDEIGVDVTRNYKVEKVEGTLTVTKIPITVASSSYEKVYDGTPLVGDVEDCEIVSERQPLDGHAWTVTLSSTQTEAGSSTNEIADVVIMNGEENVTSNYEIAYQEGILKVKPRPISLLSGTASKPYDGEPLTYDYFEIASFYQVVDGHTLEVIVAGTRTEIGMSENVITAVRISTGEGRDVTSNYEISKYYGELIVTGSTSGGTMVGGDANGAGGNLQGSSGAGGPGGALGGANASDFEKVVAKVYSTYAETLYLRTQSYGDYTGQGFMLANEYDGYLNDPYGMSYLTGVTLAGNAYNARTLRVEVLEPNAGYMLPYYLSMEDLYYTIQSKESYNTGVIASEYAMYYYPYSYQKNGMLNTVTLGAYREAELAYRAFVYDNYLSIPTSLTTRNYMQNLITMQGWSSSDKDIIRKVATYIQNAAAYNMEYDSALDLESDVVVAFLDEYKEGVCRHYAAAATMVFRMLGIPARYTVGYCVDAKAEEYTDVKVRNGHAWVEVYLNGIGWVYVEVTGGGNNSGGGTGGGTGGGIGGGIGGGTGGGTGGIIDSDVVDSNQNYTITAKSLYKRYDGTTLYAVNEVTLSQDLNTLIKEKGYTYQAIVVGSQTGVGKSTSRVQSFVLYDSLGNDVTYKYNIVRKTGILHVYLYEATIVTQGASKTYDGTPLTNDLYEASGFMSWHTVSIAVIGAQTDAGSSSNRCSITIMDGDGNDVSVEYKITYSYGKLTVSPRHIAVESGSAAQIYDRENPTKLTCHEYKLVDSFTVQNHTILITYTGSQLRIGESDNTFTLIILDAEGKNVTRNYSIDYIYGKLLVTPA